MDRRRKLLVNIGEAATDSALREAAARNNARVFAKVRVADALTIDRSGAANSYRRQRAGCVAAGGDSPDGHEGVLPDDVPPPDYGRMIRGQ